MVSGPSTFAFNRWIIIYELGCRLVFVSPLTALINLFIYILQNPQSPSVDSDIGLMYLIAGHFSYLEYAVADRSFPFVAQIANLARLTANNARSRCLGIDQELLVDAPDRDGTMQQMRVDSFEDVNGTSFYGPQHTNGKTVLMIEQAQLDRMSLDNEEWATLIGWPEGDYLNDPYPVMR
jgi:hypothetical protein